MAKQSYGGVYANMEFKPYSWTEYPKHITTGTHGKFEIANSKEEEDKILAKLQKDEDDAPAIVAPMVSDPEKQILISRATELGVAFNPKWSKAKLERVIQEADVDADDLPAIAVGNKKMKAAMLEIEDEEPSKESLIAQAVALGIPANKLWGIPRLKASIAQVKTKE